MSLSPEKIRAARALLNWSQERLAEEASIGTATLKRLEKTVVGKSSKATQVVENAVESALAAAGIILDPTPDDFAAGNIAACVAIRKILRVRKGRSMDTGKKPASMTSLEGRSKSVRKVKNSAALPDLLPASKKSAPKK